MRTRTLWTTTALALLAVLASGPAQADRVHGGTIALVNVRVVSMDPDARKKVQKRRTILVEDGRITEIGKAKQAEVPEGAFVVNGRNKLYVLPGLADLHAHARGIPELPEFAGPEDVYTFYLANGVTTLFDPSGFKLLFAWRRDVQRGRVVGPDMYFTAPIIDEVDYASLDELEADLRKWAREGYAWVKTHDVETPAFFERLFAVSRELGLPVVGHALRPGFPIQDTLAQQPLMIAHIEEILSTSVTDPSRFEDQLATPLRDVANSRVWVTGTVNTYEMIANTRDDATFQELLDRPEVRYMPPSVLAVWQFENRYRQPEFGGDRDFWLSQLDVKLYIARRLVELGALDRLLLGTDTGIEGIVPGFSVHDELRLLVAAGLSPFEAIQTGTYNAAAFLDLLDEVGTVEEGKRADLLVAKRNPLRRIGALSDPAGVMVNGLWLSESDLEARLEELAARWVD